MFFFLLCMCVFLLCFSLEVFCLLLGFGFFSSFVQTSRVENKVKIEGVKESQEEAPYLFTTSNS